MKLFGKITIETKKREKEETRMPKTKRKDVKPSQAIDSLQEIKWTKQSIEHATKKTYQTKKNKLTANF